MAEKLTKQSVNYGPVTDRAKDHCGLCKHFDRPSACRIVEGVVSRWDWCSRFGLMHALKRLDGDG